MSKVLKTNGVGELHDEESEAGHRIPTASDLTSELDAALRGTTYETGLERLKLSQEAVEMLLDGLTKMWGVGCERAGWGWKLDFLDGNNKALQAVRVVLELHVDLMPPSADDAEDDRPERSCGS
jgi:hypothetical protein